MISLKLLSASALLHEFDNASFARHFQDYAIQKLW